MTTPDRRAADRYGRDVLAAGAAPTPGHRVRRPSREVAADPGLVVEDVETGWCGAVVRTEAAGGVAVVVLEDRRGRTRTFPLGPGFLLDGAPVQLVRPRPAAGSGAGTPGRGAAGAPGAGRARTASGSFAVAGARARVARASRILVEGRHDAELVEKVWGADLRLEGVVVEQLDGADDLPTVVAAARPGPGRRVGVLLDHLVPGSKESRLAAAVQRSGHVLVVGHPYVDIWAAVRPQRLGLDAWPDVPRGRPWKEGVLDALGWPRASAADVAQGWQRVLGTVRGYGDLEPALLGRVEELIDFVTADAQDR